MWLYRRAPERTLLHEIQHIESMSPGSSVDYWAERDGRKNSGAVYREAYRNTAGEIEARDTAARMSLTEEERRLQMPDRGDGNTRFADGSRMDNLKDERYNEQRSEGGKEHGGKERRQNTAENDRERAGLAANTGGGSPVETEHGFYAEAQRRGQVVRVFREDGQGNDRGRFRRAVRFTEVAAEEAHPIANETKAELERLGVPAFIHNGDMEVLFADGTTDGGGDAATVHRIGVGIRKDLKASPKNTAGHEAYHFWRGQPERMQYTAVVRLGIQWTLDKVSSLDQFVNEKYFHGKFDLFDETAQDYKKNLTLYMEEMVAYITGDLHAGEDVNEYLDNIDEVKGAWQTLIEQMKGDGSNIQNSFSPSETADAEHEAEAEQPSLVDELPIKARGYLERAEHVKRYILSLQIIIKGTDF